MIYKVRPGVCLEKVCGEYLLVAARQARGKCPYVNGINETAGEYFSLLLEERDSEEIVRIMAERYETDEDRIKPGFLKLVDSFIRLGYIIQPEAESGYAEENAGETGNG